MQYLALTLPGGKTVQAPGSIPSGGLDTVSKAISVALSIMIIICIILTLFFLIWGGIAWTTSGGDKGKITAARARITYAIVGLIVAISSFFLVNLFGGFFGVKLV